MASDVVKADGTVDFSGGVNSVKVTTVQSPRNPNGLSRNELAWLNNAHVRDGGITQRYGYSLKGRIISGSGIYQGGWMYEALDGSSYPIVAIGGHIYRLDPETGRAIDLSSTAFQTEQVQIGIYIQNLDVPVTTVTPVEAGTVANTQFGLLGNITAPAINSTQFVALANPYLGPVRVTIPISSRFTLVSATLPTLVGISGQPGFYYEQATVTLRNENCPVGTSVGVQPSSGLSGWATQAFVAPAIGANVVVNVNSNVRSGPTIGFTLNESVLFDVFHYFLVNSSTPTSLTDPGTHPAFLDYYYFCQAEEFLIIQAGDYKTLPLFWDGTTLRRSRGITDTAIASSLNGINELPAAGPMDYYMGRVWYAQHRNYTAGDIVGGPSGSGKYNFRDSVLNVTENPLAIGGDGFRVPDSSGDITALKHNANIDAALGQGRLFISTLKTIYSLTVPVSRTDWIGATNTNQPLQTVVQLANGSVNDRSVVAVNGDLFFQSLEPAIRSLMTAIRYFGQWGNIPFSANENRVMQLENRNLLRFASGINFNNRLFMTALPRQVAQGVIHQGLIPLDFMPISTFSQPGPPVWEGIHQGLNVLQLLSGRINDVERAFAITLSDLDSGFDLWELTLSERFDTGDKRVRWVIEFPSLNWGKEFDLKKLVACELWVDRMYGEVVYELDYRPDSDPCWHLWHKWKQCSARNSCEDVFNPICYPIIPFAESFRSTMITPQPPTSDCDSITGRPSWLGYQFQVRLTITGFCRVRGILLWAEDAERKLYDYIFVCNTQTPP